ncbi:MAG: hypothetical protein ACK5MQ_17455 [Pikeienuella sp.]
MAHNSVLIRRAYLFFACLASGALAGCVGAGPEIFDRLPAHGQPQDAGWPRLADIPPTPPAGTHTEAAPDPALGDAAQIELAAAAEAAERRRREIEGPVE